MNYFLDTEFNQNVDPVQLISLGIVAEDGREFYAIADWYEPEKCDDWIKKNVFANLLPESTFKDQIDKTKGMGPMIGSQIGVRNAIERFLIEDGTPQFWGYYADYDWYLFTRLWGFMNMPEKFPRLCFDLQQYAYHLQVPKSRFPAPFEPQHNALVDARWNKRLYDYLTSIAQANW